MPPAAMPPAAMPPVAISLSTSGVEVYPMSGPEDSDPDPCALSFDEKLTIFDATMTSPRDQLTPRAAVPPTGQPTTARPHEFSGAAPRWRPLPLRGAREPEEFPLSPRSVPQVSPRWCNLPPQLACAVRAANERGEFPLSPRWANLPPHLVSVDRQAKETEEFPLSPRSVPQLSPRWDNMPSQLHLENVDFVWSQPGPEPSPRGGDCDCTAAAQDDGARELEKMYEEGFQQPCTEPSPRGLLSVDAICVGGREVARPLVALRRRPAPPAYAQVGGSRGVRAHSSQPQSSSDSESKRSKPRPQVRRSKDKSKSKGKSKATTAALAEALAEVLEAHLASGATASDGRGRKAEGPKEELEECPEEMRLRLAETKQQVRESQRQLADLQLRLEEAEGHASNNRHRAEVPGARVVRAVPALRLPRPAVDETGPVVDGLEDVRRLEAVKRLGPRHQQLREQLRDQLRKREQRHRSASPLGLLTSADPQLGIKRNVLTQIEMEGWRLAYDEDEGYPDDEGVSTSRLFLAGAAMVVCTIGLAALLRL